MKTKTKRAEILSHGEEQKLIKLMTYVVKESPKKKLTTRYCTILGIDGKKLLDYKDTWQEEEGEYVAHASKINCEQNFFVIEKVSTTDKANPYNGKCSYQVYTYEGIAIAGASGQWPDSNCRDNFFVKRLIEKMSKLADEANKNPENEL